MDTKEQILYLRKININKLGLTSLQITTKTTKDILLIQKIKKRSLVAAKRQVKLKHIKTKYAGRKIYYETSFVLKKL